MTGGEHYRKALNLMHQVQSEVAKLGDTRVPYEDLQVFNANCMRTLKIAELHMMAAQYLGSN
jgi:hypothetical protein